MSFCRKCGVELAPNDVFCPNCGFQNEPEEQAAEPVIPQMTKDESIAFADKLIAEYKKLEKIDKEIEENDHQISRPIDAYPKQHAAFKYFWPFLIYAAVSCSLFSVLARVFERGAIGLALIFSLLSIASIPVFLIVGGVRAVRIRNELNAAEVSFQNNKKDHLNELVEENKVLKNKRTIIKNKLKEYDAMLPPSLRSSTQIAKAKLLVQSGKASDFADAVEQLGRF